LGSIYSLDTSLEASSYLTDSQSLSQEGALLIRNSKLESPTIEIGIAFQPHISEELNTLQDKPFSEWNLSQKRAFSVATEEISHFRYFIHHLSQAHQVRRLELEFQGELDRFLIFYLLQSHSQPSWPTCYAETFSQLFEQYSLSSQLSPEEKIRYEEASQIAREFIHKHRAYFTSQENFSKLLGELRALYRMSPPDKFSLIHRL